MIASPHRCSGRVALLVLAVSSCGPRDRSSPPDAATTGPATATVGGSNGGVGAGAGAADAATNADAATGGALGPCPAPGVVDPPVCKLARSVVASSSFGPGRGPASDAGAPTSPGNGALPVVATVVRREGDEAVESTEVWDARSGRVVSVVAKGMEPRGGALAAWTPDGKRVAVAGITDSHLGFRILDATAGFQPLFEDPDIQSQFPCAVAIDPAGARVAMTTLLGTARIHDLETGTFLVGLTTTPQRAAGHVCSVLQWSGDGKAIQVEGLRESKGLRPIPRRSARDPRPSIPREDELVQLQLSPRGDLAAFLDERGNIRLFSGNGTAFVKSLPAGRGVPASRDPEIVPVRALSWRPDAAAIATWDQTGKIRVWDVAKAGILREMRAKGPPFEGAPDPEVEDARLVWAPDGQAFAFWSGERTELWSVGDGLQKLDGPDVPKPAPARPATTAPPHPGRPGAGGGSKAGATSVSKADSPGFPTMRFSHDGALLAAGDAVWEVKTGHLVRRLPAVFDHWVSSGGFVSLASDLHVPTSLRIVRVADGAVLVVERLGDDTSPALLAHTEDGVFQGPVEQASCALPPTPDPADAGPPPAPPLLPPEPRGTLLADYWAGRSVARRCPVR